MAANPAFDALRELLVHRPAPLPGEAVLSTGLTELDQALAGGFPRGTLVTLEGMPSSGASSVVARLLAAATRESLAALVCRTGRLSPQGLQAAGVRLERLVVVPVETPLAVVQAADILIRAGTFSAIAIPLPAPARGLGAATWSRLGSLAQRHNVVLAVSGTDPPAELASAAAVRLELAIDGVRFAGESGLFGALTGYDVTVRVRKHRRAPPGGSARLRCEPFEPR